MPKKSSSLKKVTHKKMKPSAISLQHVTKTYRLHHIKPTFVEHLFNRKKQETFTALRDVSLEIKTGERVGIIGHNGAGKTTLLKIITGITTPTAGELKTKGRIVSLIDLEAGFHPDLTGEENIFLNGLVLGLSKRDIQAVFADIVAFADIGTFIDTPFHTYSQGMKLRLGFAVGVHASPDILILDENVATGDQWFVRKAEKRIKSLFKQGKTIVMVSHDLDLIRQNCTKIIWMSNNQVHQIGGHEVIDEYIGTLH